ncbi:hypothetical protein CLV62_101194 [Dysgonomonas alginatilytica]|uniref:Uncharacterized protein n=1 Tax=Dysgonomonas alginatilytica TaxID=1605892 RepID=A0A2V3PWH1_9BACT|nr:hypothetical protein [Dysgonomonas alginatilytica]PXV68928.1 hypothetical protein CLV62_101194 [Dysgonomonas alginatilytica]
MKHIIFKTLSLALIWACCITLQAQAQVGIITTAPRSTLDVTAQPLDGGITDGIIAPLLTRAQLIAKDAQYGTNQTDAIVYITTIDGVVTTKTAKVTTTGYYFFDGSIWQNIDRAGSYFYLPPFILPTTSVGAGKTFDLYTGAFSKQFNLSGNTLYKTSNSILQQIPSARYTANQLDYVVTYYDTDIIKINSISTTGIINYDVLSTVYGPAAFINVVVITK